MSDGSLAPRGPLALIVLDGWGLRQAEAGNAVALASTPVWDGIWQRRPSSRLEASGEAVGLGPGQIGNSNVGHLNLGAGRVVEQPLRCIDRLVETGQFARLPVIRSALTRAREGATLHLAGLCSDGGVHSHLRHLFALLELARDAGVARLAVHAFLDGRDVGPRSAGAYLDQLEDRLAMGAHWRLATLCGRYFAMDRDARWDRTLQAYELLVKGRGRRAQTWQAGLAQAYAAGESDEFVPPTAVVAPHQAPAVLADGDVLMLFNFRADRARQLVRMLTEPEPPGGVDRPALPRLQLFSMTRYDRRFDLPYAVASMDLSDTFGQVISEHGLRQLRIAETEKYAHVTYFFNGGREEAFPGESRRIVPSPRVETHDQQPEMSAREVTDTLLGELGEHDVVIVNYANPDMVGHTGVLAAAIRAVEVVDVSLGRVLERLAELAGAALVLSDHGNAEQLLAEDGSPHTAHTMNPVPCVLVHPGARGVALADGVLGNVAPTLLELLGIAAPAAMTCSSLIRRDR